MTPRDPGRSSPKPAVCFISEHGLKGLEGIKAADAALRATKPELLTEYAGFVVSGGRTLKGSTTRGQGRPARVDFAAQREKIAGRRADLLYGARGDTH